MQPPRVYHDTGSASGTIPRLTERQNSMRIIAMLLLAVAPALAAAQDVPDRVGRIAYIDGSAAVYRDAELGWDKAWVNSPVTSENSLWTEPDSRAELRIGGTAIRLNEATQLDVAKL